MILQTSKNSWHYINKGISWINYNELKKALSHFDKALHVEPDNLVAQFHKGTTLYKLDRIDEAILCFDKIIDADPKNIDALLNKGL